MKTTDTAQAKAYELLRDMIMSGHYWPGQKLTISKIASDIDCGTMPTRYAVRRLSTMMGLTLLPKRSVRVPVLTLLEWRQTIELVRVLETACVDKMRKHPGVFDLRELNLIVEQYANSIENSNYIEASNLMAKFWLTFYSLAGSPSLFSLLEKAWLRLGPTFSLQFSNQGSEVFKWTDKRLEVFKSIAQALEDFDYSEILRQLDAMFDAHNAWYPEMADKRGKLKLRV